jgi:glycosyltransferase involved in cell wall biosynthesis
VSDRPRLLVLITLAEAGGAQTYVAALLPALVERFEVTVAAWGPGPLRDAARRAGAEFVPLEHVRRAIHPAHDVLGLVELVRLCRRVRPHVVHANSSKAGFLGRIAAAVTRVPVRIFTVHGWAFKQYTGLASTLYRWAERAMVPLTTHIVCVAQAELRAGLVAGTCRTDRTTVIENAVDVGAAPRAALAGKPPRVMSVGRLKEPKDFFTFARALALLEPGTFVASVVGEGPDRPELEREIARLGVALELVGERDDVPALLAASDVFVLSSKSEGMPIAILEAMAAGLPIVATRVGGVPELVVEGGTGLLVPPGDVEALAAGLRQLLGDSDLRRRLGAAGRTRAEQCFDLPRFHAAHFELYRVELASRGLPTP